MPMENDGLTLRPICRKYRMTLRPSWRRDRLTLRPSANGSGPFFINCIGSFFKISTNIWQYFRLFRFRATVIIDEWKHFTGET